MHSVQILLGLLATSASAIDIYGYKNNDKCNGNNYVVSTNVNPDVCAVTASGNVYRSISFRAIPTNWNIIGRAFNGGDCKNINYVVQSSGRTDICLGGNDYSGGSYGFANKKRSAKEGVAEEACSAVEAEGCASVAKADKMVFENGPQYNLVDLDEALYTEL
ncbi:hypothetical protein PG984_014703 [Apiospora sp. TS-2023a]